MSLAIFVQLKTTKVCQTAPYEMVYLCESGVWIRASQYKADPRLKLNKDINISEPQVASSVKWEQ